VPHRPTSKGLHPPLPNPRDLSLIPLPGYVLLIQSSDVEALMEDITPIKEVRKLANPLKVTPINTFLFYFIYNFFPQVYRGSGMVNNKSSYFFAITIYLYQTF
jgi:hypothetical protein